MKMRVLRVLLPFLLLAQSFGCALQQTSQVGEPSEASPGAVKFTMAGPNEAAIIVPVKINGQGPYDFVLDTGATFTCVDSRFAEELKLPEWKGSFGTVVVGPGGGGMKLFKIETLEVGNAKAAGLIACAVELDRMAPPGLGIKGLVGLNFLKSYRVNIDFKKKSLQLDKP
ncbi:MAG TPA: retropepsin-like aspartic protease [Pyrinomonadaceae bacterium]|nr:retropepsin-like aspartic protease [Pyrinomonadaceae bacterium]